MNRWRSVNAWAGYVALGLPAVVAVPALIATLARFGPWDTLSALPAVLWACTPGLLWLRYTRRGPTRRRGRITWSLLGVLAVAMLLVSPIWFWSGPVLCVLASEALRLAVAAAVARLPVTRHRGGRRAEATAATRSAP